jgi:hypothetical protein
MRQLEHFDRVAILSTSTIRLSTVATKTILIHLPKLLRTGTKVFRKLKGINQLYKKGIAWSL